MKKLLILILISAALLTSCAAPDYGIGLKADNTAAPTERAEKPTAEPEPDETPLPAHQGSDTDGKRYDGTADIYSFCSVNNDDGRYVGFVVELTRTDTDGTKHGYDVRFILPTGWYCLTIPYSDEAYLGSTKGSKAYMFASRLFIYDDEDSCVGAVGLGSSIRSMAEYEGDEKRGVNEFYHGINSDPDYRFATDEYYLIVARSTLQFSDRFDEANTNAITEVYYSKEYLCSLGYNFESDKMNVGILSSRPGDKCFVAFEFYYRILDMLTLNDIARSVYWGGERTS